MHSFASESPPLLSGPFSNQEMAEWFQAGYFTMSLLVKRGCDEVFQPLGEIMKIWGRVPFTLGSAPPPLQVCLLNVACFDSSCLEICFVISTSCQCQP